MPPTANWSHPSIHYSAWPPGSLDGVAQLPLPQCVSVVERRERRLTAAG